MKSDTLDHLAADIAERLDVYGWHRQEMGEVEPVGGWVRTGREHPVPLHDVVLMELLTLVQQHMATKAKRGT